MDEKETKIREEKKPNKVKYLITIGVYTILVILLMWNDRTFSKETLQEVLVSISNGFFIAGGLFAGVGALSYIGSKGTYDTLSYGISKIGIHHLIPGISKEVPESFYEYKTAKDEKGRIWFPNLLYVGLAGILLSMIFAVMYSFM